MYSNTHNVADLTNEELYRMRDYGKFDSDREAAAAELARREQAAQPEAQPTPGPWEVAARRPINYEELAEFDAVWVERGAECIALVFGDPESEMLANAALIARAHKLAAENERLRGLLADAYSELLSHHLSKAGDLGIPHDLAMTMISEMPLMQRIEAAKEAAHAK